MGLHEPPLKNNPSPSNLAPPIETLTPTQNQVEVQISAIENWTLTNMPDPGIQTALNLHNRSVTPPQETEMDQAHTMNNSQGGSMIHVDESNHAASASEPS